MSLYHTKIMLLMVTLLLVLAACDGAAPTLGGELNPQAALCQSVAAVRSATAQLSDINPNTRLSDVTAAKSRLDTLVEALRAANGVLQRPAINDLLTTYDGFSAQLSAVATQETLGTAVDGLRQNLGAVNTALDQANTTLGCQ